MTDLARKLKPSNTTEGCLYETLLGGDSDEQPHTNISAVLPTSRKASSDSEPIPRLSEMHIIVITISKFIPHLVVVPRQSDFPFDSNLFSDFRLTIQAKSLLLSFPRGYVIRSETGTGKQR
ncbi:hypothetical protein WG66_008322 [Moniliophthora roreri]|nr:hypothetical protein WG66_008322 [Moniliophthora roreri]